MSNPISVCMIVKNEAQNLARCLNSLRPYVNELIVVDTGSTDGTPELALAVGARVFSFPWTDDFSAARNFALEQATEAWVLVVDADEELDTSSAAALTAWCTQTPARPGRVALHNVAEQGEVSVAHLLRLFPNHPSYRYRGRIHEQLLWEGQAPAAGSTDVVLLHYGYAQEAVDSRNKIDRNLRLLQLEVAEHPEEPYTHYQLGKTYFVSTCNQEAALQFQTAVDLLVASGQTPPYLPNLLVQYAYTLVRLQEFAHVEELVSVGIDLYPDYTDLYFVYGVALIEAGDPTRLHEVRDVFELCLRLGEPDPAQYETVRGVGSYRAQHNLGVFYEVTGDHEQARTCYQLAAAAGYAPAAERLQAIGK